jgi:hypothetical protein
VNVTSAIFTTGMPCPTGEFGAVGASALDADRHEITVRAQPVEQAAIAVGAGGK